MTCSVVCKQNNANSMFEKWKMEKKRDKKKGSQGRKMRLGAVVALIMGKNGEKMDFGYGKTFLEKVSWGGPETPFCGISGPIPACGGVYTEKWTKF